MQDRFYDEAQAAKQHRYQFLPFGAGPRMCLGAGFAQVSASHCSFGQEQLRTLEPSAVCVCDA